MHIHVHTHTHYVLYTALCSCFTAMSISNEGLAFVKFRDNKRGRDQRLNTQINYKCCYKRKEPVPWKRIRG